MRVAAILVLIGLLAACAVSSDLPPQGSYGRNQQVQRDVQAIQQGMNYARSQAQAVARARAQ
jgi:hypothetical protein